MPAKEHKGSRFTIRYCEGAEESFHVALAHVPSDRHAACTAQFVVRRNRLAAGLRMRSPDHFNTEAKLPDGKSFYAIKTTQGVRAYGWYGGELRVFWISHFIFKNQQKLNAADTNRVCENWRHIEAPRTGRDSS